MKPEDKFGNEIYTHVYDELYEYGVRLMKIGYQESRNKPNLFYFPKFGDVTFFLDIRGTREVKIWEDTHPCSTGISTSRCLTGLSDGCSRRKGNGCWIIRYCFA
ncbi:hypothetical protein [Halorhabdus salina]|uniref:hypothetical protein n=1 Tax=Halorhabdus salina TaxID=2750670 RepID=UPI0015EE3B6C|nr:hypothetical protein [Halorhabdus salina]